MPREILTLRKPPDPMKIALSLQMRFRFIDRKGRYILQAYISKSSVHYHIGDDRSKPPSCSLNYCCSWIDVPLVPETYGEAQA